MARPANHGRPRLAPKEGLMFRKFILAALEVFPGMRSLTDIFPSTGDGDNRGSIDPNG